MAKTKNLTNSNVFSTYDSLEDEVDFIITTDETLDDAFSKTVEDQIEGIVDSPLTEALIEAENRLSYDGGDKSLVVNINQDFSDVAPNADMLDIAADDLIATERDMIYDDDELVDLVADAGK